MRDTGLQIKRRTNRILRSQGRKRSNLIPILQEIQAEFGYLPDEAMLEVARFIGIPRSAVYGVATFYNQFRFTPPGKHPIKVCMGTACHMKGGKIITEAWERRLDIKVGETTPDLEFGLERVACVGCCAMAPVTVVEGTFQGKMTPTKVDGILLSFQLNKEKDEQKNGDQSS